MPPFIAVAVKVTEVPEQTGLAEAATETLTGINGFSTMMIVLDVAGEPVAQVSFEVSLQVTMSLFNGKYAYTGLSVPTIVPLTFH